MYLSSCIRVLVGLQFKLIFTVFSINVLNCQLHGFFSEVIKGIRYVISRKKLTGRRSVIALPIVGPPSKDFDDAAEEAVKENIVLVASAGK